MKNNMGDLVGKKAYMKSGFFEGLVGTIVEGYMYKFRITRYVLNISGYVRVGISDRSRIVLVDDCRK